MRRRLHIDKISQTLTKASGFIQRVSDEPAFAHRNYLTKLTKATGFIQSVSDEPAFAHR